MLPEEKLESSCAAFHRPLPGELPDFAPTIPVDRNDQKGLHIIRVTTLNPYLIKFRLGDIDGMDDDTKSLLIADINEALDIQFS